MTEARMQVLVDDMERERIAARDQALDWIKVAEDIDEQMRPLQVAREQARGHIKRYLELHADELDRDEKDEPFLWHPDLSVTYALQGRTVNGYDLVSAAEAEPEVVINAAKQGWLSAKHEQVEAHPGASWVERLKRYHLPLRGSAALVKKGRR